MFLYLLFDFSELQYVSPKLLKCRDLELAIPGSYVPGKSIIHIAQIQSYLQVITSKQRPRKLCITGSNGKDFVYLLKGHEDLRQDERVMQLFGLVNTLLLSDPETFRRNLTIQVCYNLHKIKNVQVFLALVEKQCFKISEICCHSIIH